MADAQLRVLSAGPLVSIQDAGRFGQLRFGVGASGPMDRLAYASAFAALGVEAGAPALEVSAAGVLLECVSGQLSCAVAGGEFQVLRDGQSVSPWSVITLSAGDRLQIRAGARGSFCYLAFAGTLCCKRWLGSAATHTQSGLGGGSLRAGQTLWVDETAELAEREGPLQQPSFGDADEPVRVVMGPQHCQFAAGVEQVFLAADYRLSSAFDRMGVRLQGPCLALNDALSIPSEAVLRGSVQVSGEGVPTILLADHQSTGGYPKIATVISSELDRVAQMRAGDTLRFTAISPEQAVAHSRRYAQRCDDYLQQLAAPRESLSQRLWQHNLISGVVDAGG